MKVNDKLGAMYDGYYGDLATANKRRIAAKQTVNHLRTMLSEHRFRRVIDVGAGEGAVLAMLDNGEFADELHAVDISASGVDAIRRRGLTHLRSATVFDGYNIPGSDDYYDLGMAIHVLEHVEHERAFLAELTRKCRWVYVEVPLELTLRVNISTSARYGHINLYTPKSFRNLLQTSELDVLSFQVFPNSLEYEMLLGGRVGGTIKHALRSTFLEIAPHLATFAMTYLAAAVVRRAAS